MSLDIDWSLLSPSTLSSHLVDSLNIALSTAPRPSVIGPISITSFDFGTVAPDVEIKDIRDVWRAFDEGDEEGDDAEEPSLRVRRNDSGQSAYSGMDGSHEAVHGDLRFQANGHGHGHGHGRNGDGGSGMGDHGDSAEFLDETMDDHTSIYSGLASPRQSIAAVGIGIGLGGMHRQPHLNHHNRDRDSFSASGILSPGLGGLAGLGGLNGAHRTPSMFSQPLNPHYLRNNLQHQNHIHTHTRANTHSSLRRRPSPSAALPLHSHHSPPPSPPARPAGVSESKSSIPSLQLHMRIDYNSNMTLTLLTSLSINYPSPGFMSLPLKLSITGLTISADCVLAYSGDKHRVHVCLLDEEDGGAMPVGQRLLPNLSIDSEIGHADAHVLKNVGKVERFIADVVRKTLVDELVFPNFMTIAL